MKKYIVLFTAFFLLFACNKPVSKDNTAQVAQEKTPFPIVHNNLRKGQIVLAPPQKFVKKFLESDSNNFFAFYPRIVDSAGKYESRLKEFDTISVIPNALIIPLGDSSIVKPGDFVLTWWQHGTGLQRAYVLDVLYANRLVVRYLDLEWTNVLTPQDAIDTIKIEDYRLISKPLDPGSSIAVKKGSQLEYFIVINEAEDKIIGLSWAGEIEIFDREKIIPNKVKKDLFVGQKVKVPMYGFYLPGEIIKLNTGYVKVRVTFMGNKEYLNIPNIDVLVE